MIIDRARIIQAMILNCADIRRIMAISNIHREDVKSSRFVGMTDDGRFVYEILYGSTYENMGVRNVYFRYMQSLLTKDLQLVATI